MRRPTTTILLALLLAAGCARGGSCRPAPDPEPACTPGEDCPVVGEQPGKPIEQPAPAPP